MDKLEVQKRVLKNGEPLSLDDFIWDEKTNTFSSVENSLVLDFNWIHDCTFNTDSCCTFNTGSGCTFNTDYDCTFNTGSGCTFNTDSGCTFNTNSGCTFHTGYGCTFNTGSGCTFNTDYDCTFNTDYDCTFHTGFGCTFKINDYKFPIAPLRFNGSRYYIEVSGPSLIRSGCIEKPVKWWQENIKRCAEENSYTPGQVKEYEFYVEILAKWLDRFGKEIQVTNKPEQGGK